ncbi:late competence development ComFB family protein [Thermocoleostomius sinensis]|uniref:Late competence development ComFB family protein n=1 Tax=Thermocoleostomius sinensis A174 TaxID=2016057 RepID=A0A9E8ZGB6_9CYAN|nr:late competence development ComFB family protein [Thermocoleostomius sinensis]WAL60818.1 late competence development ComFB family protein [Thermocoleostomius sinensis A174]
MEIYKNVMELLVEEEVARQFKLLPPRLASYVKEVELTAYALNQLPALYATSEQGLEYQLKRGNDRYKSQISQAVQRALAAVSRDPLRNSSPLQAQAVTGLRDVLHQLRLLLKNDTLEWENLPSMVEQALRQATRRGAAWDGRRAGRLTPDAGKEETPFATHYPIDATTSPTISSSPADRSSVEAGVEESFGWDDPLYHSH